jgi:gluconokinase
MGIYNNLEQAAKSIALPEQYSPKKNLHSIYMKNFAIFEKLSVKLKDDFENVVKLQ